MNTQATFFISTRTLLLSSQALGFWGCFGLFALCFFGVHLLKLAQIGWTELQNNAVKEITQSDGGDKPPAPAEKTPETPAQREKPTPAEREPIYYIVERKKKRAKSTYSAPREISFKPTGGNDTA